MSLSMNEAGPTVYCKGKRGVDLFHLIFCLFLQKTHTTGRAAQSKVQLFKIVREQGLC